jgi:shikimate 5-dehydrogenase
MVLIAGTNPNSRMMALAVSKRGGVPIIAGRDRQAALEIAQTAGCRLIPWEALYSTAHDTLIVCENPTLPKGESADAGIHYGYLKPNITVLDLTSIGKKSTLVQEAEQRGCPVVSPRQLLIDQLQMQLKLISGQQAARTKLLDAMNATLGEE